MLAISVNSKNDKTLESAFNLLKDLGYDVEIDDCLSLFNREEARFRIENISLSDKDLEIYDKLTEEEKDELVFYIAERYDESDILDYDLLDNIITNCFNDFMDNKKEEV